MADSSFDIVSKLDQQEIDNAINQAQGHQPGQQGQQNPQQTGGSGGQNGYNGQNFNGQSNHNGPRQDDEDALLDTPGFGDQPLAGLLGLRQVGGDDVRAGPGERGEVGSADVTGDTGE